MELTFDSIQFEIGAVVDYALENSLRKRELMSLTGTVASKKPTLSSDSSVESTAAHLLMKTKEVVFWDSGILSLLSKSPKW